MTPGQYDPVLLVLSILVAVFSSYVALDLGTSLSRARGRARSIWLAAGPAAMGTGIWSMHFIGMLAYHAPGLQIAYDVPRLTLSVLIAIAGSFVALHTVSRPRITRSGFIMAALTLGAAISGMHYVGVWSMRTAAVAEWNPYFVAASVLIAVIASLAGLVLAFRFRPERGSRGRRDRLLGGVVLGGAIAGMHFTAMRAMTLRGVSDAGAPGPWEVLDTPGLAVAVVLTTGLILALALGGAAVDRAMLRRQELVRDKERLYERAERERERAEAARSRASFLSDAAAILASSLDYEDTLARIAELAVPALADYCLVDVIDPDGELVRVAVSHVDPEGEARLRESGLGAAPRRNSGSPARRVLETGLPEFVTAVDGGWLEAAAQTPEHLALMRELDPRSVIIVPLAARGERLGLLWLVSSASRREYDTDDLALAEQLADRAAVAVDNARLYEEARRRAREEEALRVAASAVSASFTTEEIIRRIARSALQATASDDAFVERVDHDVAAVNVVGRAGDRVPDLGATIPYEGSFAEEAIQREEVIVVPDVGRAERPFPGGVAERCGGCPALVVPLLDAGEPIGTLTLLRSPHRQPYHTDEIEQARTFADLAALAFQKVHMMEESERRRRELEQVTESRARLMRGFSHDLKNPLGAADGHAQLLEDGILGDLTDRQRQSVGRIRGSIRTALELINDLVELARAEAGTLEIRSAPTDLREVAREMAGIYRAQAEKAGLGLDVEVPDRVPVVRSDPSRVRQVLSNLLSNAIKYTEQGRVRLYVREEDGGRERPGGTVETAGGRWVVAGVEDTGRGIAVDKRNRLFNEFTRLAPEHAEGAGLGLAISLRVAEALGGRITVRSAVGEGSDFQLWLPYGDGGSANRVAGQGARSEAGAGSDPDSGSGPDPDPDPDAGRGMVDMTAGEESSR